MLITEHKSQYKNCIPSYSKHLLYFHSTISNCSHSHPLTSSLQSHQYQLERVKANTCCLRNKSRQPMHLCIIAKTSYVTRQLNIFRQMCYLSCSPFMSSPGSLDWIVSGEYCHPSDSGVRFHLLDFWPQIPENRANT